ncbi:MAG TPA: cell division protein ZapA [Alphaproteobacteria bacterium]
MAEMTVTINGRAYQVACEDGQEAHLQRLATYIDQRVADLVKDVGQVGDARLLVMVSLLIADELADVYDELAELKSATAVPPQPDPETVRAAEAAQAAATAAEARAAAAEAAAREAQERLSAVEAELARSAQALQVHDEVAENLERLTARVTALAERIERERV